MIVIVFSLYALIPDLPGKCYFQCLSHGCFFPGSGFTFSLVPCEPSELSSSGHLLLE